MRRLLACFGLGLLLLPTLAQGTASAHPEHGAVVEWRTPGDGERLSGSVQIRARVSFGDDGVQSWSVDVVAPPGAAYPGFGTICEQSVGGAPRSADIDCPWDTAVYPDGHLSQNRPYVIRITGTNADRSIFSPDPQPHTSERAVSVANGADAPSGVSLSFSQGSKQATVRWAPNHEPDITSYVIQERFGSGAWRTVGEAGSQLHSFSRRLSNPGTYRYQVAARRSTGHGDETLQSAYAGPAGEPREITVAEPPKPPPPTTTTTAPPKKGDDQPAPGPAPGGSEPGPGSDPGPGPRPPAGDGPPVPVQAGGTTGDNPAPPPEGSAPAPPGAPPAPPAFLTPIAPGSPGSVGMRGTTAGNLIQKGGAVAAGPAPAAPEPDGPFSETLPYPKADPPPAPPEEDEGIGKVLVGLPAVIAGDKRRDLIIPLAAGLIIFMVAMHAFYLSRRTGGDGPLEADF